MKSKPIARERVYQIINDIAEDMGVYTKAELVQVVNRLQDRLCQLVHLHSIAETEIMIAHLECATKISEISRKCRDKMAES